jgi:hypothetical protein
VSVGVCAAIVFLVALVALHVGYRIGHQLGFDEGLTRAAELGEMDRQDHRKDVFASFDDVDKDG